MVSPDNSMAREFVSIALAGAGLTLLAASPVVSMAPWSRAGSSIEWVARILRGR